MTRVTASAMRIQPDQFWTYWEWMINHEGLLNGAYIVIALSILGFVISYLIALARSGPTEGFYSVAKTISELFRIDLPGTSFRRIGAIARLAFKEAIRRRVLVVVAIFVVGMMIAGWYLDRTADYPARLYISFVLQLTNYLVLLLGLFLSCFSLPNEIKSRTIYTIVTKPVRPTEIFFGRVVGFGMVGTLILLVLGGLSYLFVVRGMRHSHEVSSLSQDGNQGITSLDVEHKHSFAIGADGRGLTDEQKGHRHKVVRKTINGKEVYEIGPPEGDLVARVPVYAQRLRFTDSNGSESERGISVGYESEYQSYIEGNTLASAIWEFNGVAPGKFGDVLTMEMTLSAFRTYKGDIEKGVQGAVIFRNPDGSAESERIPFSIKEFQIDVRQYARKMKGFKDGQPAELDLYTDLAPQGKLEIIVRCLDGSQYMGMGIADLFLRAGDVPFGWNFVKGYVSIWLQLMIVISFGVMFSTFLSGPVAMIATLSCLILGFFGSMAGDILQGKMVGGGPIESMIRIPTQAGVMTEFDLGNETLEGSIKFVDQIIIRGMTAVTGFLPDFRQLGISDFVAYGINIFDGLLGRHITIAIGYFFLTGLVSYFFLKTREMAA